MSWFGEEIQQQVQEGLQYINEIQLPVVKDDQLENALQMNPELFNQYADEVKSFNMTKFKKLLNDAELKKYEKFWPKTRPSIRRTKVMSFLRMNPGFATMDPQLLYQRISFYQMNYGNTARQLYPDKPLQNTLQQARIE